MEEKKIVTEIEELLNRIEQLRIDKYNAAISQYYEKAGNIRIEERTLIQKAHQLLTEFETIMKSSHKSIYQKALEILEDKSDQFNVQKKKNLQQELENLEELKRSLLSQYRFTEASQLRERIAEIIQQLNKL